MGIINELREWGYSLLPVTPDQKPVHDWGEITYKGVTYPLLLLTLFNPKDETVMSGISIAPESLRNAYTKDEDGEPDYVDDDEVRHADEQVFEYHPDELFETEDILGIIEDLYDDIDWRPVYKEETK